MQKCQFLQIFRTIQLSVLLSEHFVCGVIWRHLIVKATILVVFCTAVSLNSCQTLRRTRRSLQHLYAGLIIASIEQSQRDEDRKLKIVVDQIVLFDQLHTTQLLPIRLVCISQVIDCLYCGFRQICGRRESSSIV